VQNHQLGEVGNKVCFDCLLSRQHFCQELLQSNDVCKDYSKSKVARFLRHSVVPASDRTCVPVYLNLCCYSLWPYPWVKMENYR